MEESISFDGSISCLQFFDKALDSPTISMKKYCQDLPEERTVKPCPHDYEFYGLEFSCHMTNTKNTKFHSLVLTNFENFLDYMYVKLKSFLD